MYFIILRDSKFQSNSGVSHLFYKEPIWRDSDITGFKLVSNQIKSWWNATLFLLKTFKWYLYNDFMKTLKTCDLLIYSQCPPGSNPRAARGLPRLPSPSSRLPSPSVNKPLFPPLPMFSLTWENIPSQSIHSPPAYSTPITNHHMTLCEVLWWNHSRSVTKNLTPYRFNSAGWGLYGQNAEIHSFPTMYIMVGGKWGRNGSKQWFSPKKWSKNSFFEYHDSGSSNFGLGWDPKF